MLPSPQAYEGHKLHSLPPSLPVAGAALATTDITSMLLAESRHNLVGGPRHSCPVTAAPSRLLAWLLR